MKGIYKDVEHPVLLCFVDKSANAIGIASSSKRRSKSFYLINP
jgi:hypothetical protein